MWDSSLPFFNFACSDGAIWYYLTLFHSVKPSARQEITKGVVRYTKKNTSILRNYVLRGNENEFTCFLQFLELWETLQPDDAYEISTDDDSRKRRKFDKVSVVCRFSEYLLPCHPYEENHTKQREVEGNAISLMAHAFTLISLVDQDWLHKMTQDLDPRLHPVGRSKMPLSLIPKEKKSVDRFVVGRLAKVKSTVIS